MKAEEYYRIIKEELWQGPSDRLEEYAYFGLKGEIGELAGQYAKFIRGDFNENELKRRLRKELSDCLWMYVAMEKEFPQYWGVKKVRIDLVLSGHLYKRIDGYIMNCVLRYVGLSSFEELADESVAKCMDRKARGVLKGDGDDR